MIFAFLSSIEYFLEILWQLAITEILRKTTLLKQRDSRVKYILKLSL